MQIDPERICRRAKLNRYYVNEAEKTVYVVDIEKIAKHLDHKLPENAEGFDKYGWSWVKGVAVR